eukprot:4385620-Amphidinium_carterae.1
MRTALGCASSDWRPRMRPTGPLMCVIQLPSGGQGSTRSPTITGGGRGSAEHARRSECLDNRD